ncbi:NUDIX hydrolase [Parafrigoribacterium mesophilum]|uniref:NUDIX hydrolase n=1 Tax=Parafrigoribacterium mesophilum TaxID=433646 RepID=UPI0031FCD8F6
MRQIPPSSEPDGTRVAATVVLVRDGDAGLEVLLVERPSNRGSFAGAWVFPGGSVDPEDWPAQRPGTQPDEEAAARNAAVREVREETGLEVAKDHLVVASKWTPPAAAPRKFRTWFYLAPAPAGEIVLSANECVDHAWLSPDAALQRHAGGKFQLVPPTWVTLYGLVGIDSAADALDPVRHAARQDFATRMLTMEDGTVMLWDGDIAYADDALFEEDGARHRLDARTLPWVYTKSVQ